MNHLLKTLGALESMLQMKKMVTRGGHSTHRSYIPEDPLAHGLKPDFYILQAADTQRIVDYCRGLGLDVSALIVDRLYIPVVSLPHTQTLSLELDNDQENLTDPYCICDIYDTSVQATVGSKTLNSFEELCASIPGLIRITSVWGSITTGRANRLKEALDAKNIPFTLGSFEVNFSFVNPITHGLTTIEINPDWDSLQMYRCDISTRISMNAQIRKFRFVTESETYMADLINQVKANNAGFILDHQANLVP